MCSIKELSQKTRELDVLYVEDNLELQQQTEMLLKKFFPSLKTCDNGMEAWKCFQKTQPKILITDLKMPLMDGKKLIENVKGFNTSIICIVISGVSSEEIVNINADFILSKPTTLEDLIEVMKIIVE